MLMPSAAAWTMLVDQLLYVDGVQLLQGVMAAIKE
jgi:hypothetical protein